MILYHGSTVDIEEIDLLHSKPNKDFGRGFYLSEDERQAQDIVYGPIANDRVGLQIRRFMENEISFETFLQRLQYMKGVTFQYFFGTQRAVNLLKKL